MVNLFQKYITYFNIIYKHQSGFWSDFSTNTCLSYLHSKILKGFEKGEYTVINIIDFHKALIQSPIKCCEKSWNTLAYQMMLLVG